MIDCAETGIDDRLDGGPGDDVFGDDCGANLATGGPGHDLGKVTGSFDGGSADDNRILADLPTSQPLGFTPMFASNPPIEAERTCEACHDGHAIGGSGNDGVVVYGGVADGGSGNDLVEGAYPSDEVLGGSGSDQLGHFTGSAGMRFDGGSGHDICNLNGSTTDTVRRCEVVVP